MSENALAHNDANLDPEDHLSQASITVAEAKRSQSPHLYVVNTSDFNGETMRGEVALKFKTEDGQTARYKIPDSWLPREITLYQPKEKWIRDIGFNSLVEKGYLTIVDPAVAEEILQSPAAKLEIKRIGENERRLAPHAETARQQANKLASEARERFKAVDSVRQINVMAEESENTVSPRVMTVMQNKQTDEQQKLAALKNFRSQITKADIGFIMQNCGKDYPRIKQWAIDLRNRG